MSIETYERLVGRFELYSAIQEGIADIQEGRTKPFQEAMNEIRANRRR